ncbi:unnamed protein product [Musa textilis]
MFFPEINPMAEVPAIVHGDLKLSERVGFVLNHMQEVNNNKIFKQRMISLHRNFKLLMNLNSCLQRVMIVSFLRALMIYIMFCGELLYQQYTGTCSQSSIKSTSSN